MTANLAPAARIVAGLQPQPLEEKMRDAIAGIGDVSNYRARQAAYADAGIDWRNYHASTFRDADYLAFWAELNARSGVSHG